MPTQQSPIVTLFVSSILNIFLSIVFVVIALVLGGGLVGAGEQAMFVFLIPSATLLCYGMWILIKYKGGTMTTTFSIIFSYFALYILILFLGDYVGWDAWMSWPTPRTNVLSGILVKLGWAVIPLMLVAGIILKWRRKQTRSV